MFKSYQVRLQANPGKLEKLEALLVEYVRLVNLKIAAFWKLEDTTGAYPPKALGTTGSSVGNSAARKAWVLVKTAKKLEQQLPVFKACSVEIGTNPAKVTFSKTTQFDGWVDHPTLEKGNRAALPFKSHTLLNAALKTGKLLKCVKLIKRKKGWFAQFSFTFPEPPSSSAKRVGIDVGANIAAHTSTGLRYGEDLKALRIRTKHRRYHAVEKMPYRQGLNRVAKEIVRDHPGCDFAMEKLHFKTGCGGSRLGRSRLQTFAYGHLADKLASRGKLEGFKVFTVNPAYTSQTCPKCLAVDKRNRNGSAFKCVVCGHEAHADLVGALNINGGKAEVWLGDAVQASSCQKPTQEYPGTINAPALKEKPKTA